MGCIGGGVVLAPVVVGGNQSQCSYMEALQQLRILVSRDQSRLGGRPDISASLKARKTHHVASSRIVLSQKGNGRCIVDLNGDGMYCSLLEMKNNRAHYKRECIQL